MKTTKKRKIHIFSVVGGILSFILLLLIAFRTAQTTRSSTENAIDKLSRFYIEELAKGRVSIISDELHKRENYVHNALKTISQEDLNSTQSLRTYLKRIRKLLNIDTYALVDENGVVYSGRSTCSGKTRYPFLSEKITAPVYSTVLNYGGEKQLYLVVPISGLYFNNAKITSCFAELNINQMMKAMTYSNENMDVYFNLYYKNGESLINSQFGKFETSLNILSVIKGNNEKSNEYNKVKKDFQEGKEGFVDVNYKNQNAHIYYIPVKNTGWILTVLVYDTSIRKAVGSSISSIMSHTRAHVIVTVIFISLLFVILILILRNNSRIAIEHEKTITRETQYAYDKLDKENKAMQILHSVLQSGPWTIEFDENNNISTCIWSETFRKMIGFTTEESFPSKLESWSDRLHKDDRERVLKAFRNTVNDTSGKTIYDVEYRLLTNNNEWKWYHAAGNIIRRPDGSAQTFIGLFTDIDEIKTNEQKLQEQISIVTAISQDYSTILRIDLNTRLLNIITQKGFIPNKYKNLKNPEASFEEFFSTYINERVYTEDIAFMKEATSFDTVIDKLKENYEYSSSYRVIEDGAIHFIEFKFIKLNENTLILGFINIDEIVRDAKEKETLRTLSETDRMTGLLNRISGETKISDSLKHGKGGLFILLDVDHFKTFNDSFGHEIGDQVIINVANALKRAFREEDIVFRLGGDEFSAYAPEVHTKQIANKIIGRFIENLQNIVIPEIGDMPITASIGATVINQGESVNFTEKYKLVDKAVYESKKIKGSYTTFV